MPSEIFISYAKEDSEVALSIQKRLNDVGKKGWVALSREDRLRWLIEATQKHLKEVA